MEKALKNTRSLVKDISIAAPVGIGLAVRGARVASEPPNFLLILKVEQFIFYICRLTRRQLLN